MPNGPRLTFLDAKNSSIPPAIGACPTDPRFLQLLNEAMERVLYQGHYVGTRGRFRFCATDGCITFPPQVAVPETIAICGVAGKLRTEWFEYLGGGLGLRTQQQSNCSGGNCGTNSMGCGCMAEAIDRGSFPSFSDVQGTNKKLTLVCDVASDVGKTALLLGYDNNNNWIRTNQGGFIKDGEVVAFAQGAGTTTLNFFSALTDVQFNGDRDGQAWLYEFNTTTATNRMIGKYEYWETRPSYRRFLFPSILSAVNSGGNGCNQTLVEGLCKLAFIPVKLDTDYLTIPCLPALKDMVMALDAAQNEPDSTKKNQIILGGIAVAVATLDKQLQHQEGDGAELGFDIKGSSIGAIDPVLALY